MTGRLVLLRHGESAWNRADRFAGWADVPLTRSGRREAQDAARPIAAAGLAPDLAFTSVLSRAIESLHLVLRELGALWVPVEKAWALNERHYGELEGRRRDEARRLHGEELTARWRWSWDAVPPPLAEDDPRAPWRDRRYASVPRERLPRSESLKDVSERVLPWFERRVAPPLREGACVLLVAHGSSLRALARALREVPEAEVEALRIPTGEPWLYELDRELRVRAHRPLRPRRPLRPGRWLMRQAERRLVRRR